MTTTLPALFEREPAQNKSMPGATMGLSRETLALNGGLVIDPSTKAIAPTFPCPSTMC